MKAELLSVRDLEPYTAMYLAAHLCRTASDMQLEFFLRLSDTPIVLVSVAEPVAWVATHEWHGHQTIEAFVSPDWRRRGLARAGVLILLATSHLVRNEPVAVFSPDCVTLARSLGFVDVLHYTRSRHGWTLSLDE